MTELSPAHKPHRSAQINMSQGPIVKQMVLFSLPLILGDVLQLLYNTTDMLIVGNFIGKAALAAVGSTAQVINIFIGFFTGLSLGATVLISRNYGADDRKKLNIAVRTTVWLTIEMGVIITVLGFLLTPLLLKLLGTTDDVIVDAANYLKIYFLGTLSQVLYNMFAGILRAVGDSKRPMYVLLFSCFLNVGLDLLFIVTFDLGVSGAAIATIISQIICALILLKFIYNIPEFRPISFRKPCFDKPSLTVIFKVGVPYGIQKAVISLSNTIILSFINYFGSGAMAGWTVYGKLDQVIVLTSQSISTAITTFDSQNLGAGKPERVHKGNMAGLLLNIVIWLIFLVIMLPGKYTIIGWFNKDPDVLYYGGIIANYMIPFHFLNSIAHAYYGMLRGQGHENAPTVISLAFMVVLRQIYLHIIWMFTHDFNFVMLAFPIAWILSVIGVLVYISIIKKKDKWLII